MMQEKCDKCGRAFNKQRSNPQNRYYWKCVIEPLSEHLGYTKDEVHDLLKFKFLREVRHFTNKEDLTNELIIGRSTTSLTTADMEKFLSNVRIWASQYLNLYIREPNETNEVLD